MNYNLKQFLQENHPAIWARIEEILKEQDREWKDGIKNSFVWGLTFEKLMWQEIYQGNYHVFYEKYPELINPENQDQMIVMELTADGMNVRDCKISKEELQSHSKPTNPEQPSQEYDYINPPHYQLAGMETFDMMIKIWGLEKVIAHCEMCAFKYQTRLGKKPDQPIERDMGKIKWYTDKANELTARLDIQNKLLKLKESGASNEQIKEIVNHAFNHFNPCDSLPNSPNTTNETNKESDK